MKEIFIVNELSSFLFLSFKLFNTRELNTQKTMPMAMHSLVPIYLFSLAFVVVAGWHHHHCRSRFRPKVTEHQYKFIYFAPSASLCDIVRLCIFFFFYSIFLSIQKIFYFVISFLYILSFSSISVTTLSQTQFNSSVGVSVMH